MFDYSVENGMRTRLRKWRFMAQGAYWDNIGFRQGLYRDNGKEHWEHYLGFRV